MVVLRVRGSRLGAGVGLGFGARGFGNRDTACPPSPETKTGAKAGEIMNARWAIVVVLVIGWLGLASEGQDKREIRVTAERFSFTPSRIEIDPGEEVEIRIKSDDTSHGFRIVGTETNVT